MGPGVLLNFLIYLLVFGVVLYCIRLVPLEEPLKRIALIIVSVLFVIWLLGLLLNAPYVFPIVRY